MGKELYERSAAAREVYDTAAEYLGMDLLQLDDSQLAQTGFAQLAIVAMSLAAWKAFIAKAGQFPEAAFAGFSLGEYSALGAAGVLSLTDLMSLVQVRSKLMQQAAERYPGAMFAVLGLDAVRLQEIVGQPHYGGRVYAANFNAPGQIVIAGLECVAADCADELKSAGARRIVRLNVNGAFHTPLMAEAAAELADFARGLAFGQPAGPFYTNTTGGRLQPDPDWPAYLARHMCSPVCWIQEVETLQKHGAATFVEFGPGQVLSGLIRKISPDSAAFSVEDSRTLQEACAKIGLTAATV